MVKELIENAVDAGATRIAVSLEEGGRKLIRVTDDGSGMSEVDLRLAVLPHATSKVTNEEDLYAIQTMGFRGEALASIAAVSKLRITSRTADSVEGHEVRAAGDRFEAGEPTGCPVGTTVEVRDLFFNVPARRKFLRTPTTETGHITEQFSRIALANPKIGFELTHNGRVTQQLPPCESRHERVSLFYGPELAEALIPIHRNERGLDLDIFAAPPAQSRANTQWQYVFVNGRYVRDRFVQHAIKEAYRGLIEPHRHGVTFVFLTIDPRDVDVNVHPTKTEVRWANSNLIHSQVLSAMRETFQRLDLTPVLRTDRATVESVDPAEQDRVRREAAEALKTMTPIRPGSRLSEGRRSPDWPTPYGSDARTPRQMGDVETWRAMYEQPSIDSVETDHSAEDDARGSALPLSDRASLIGDAPVASRTVQMHNLYLVSETEDGIVIVDQHALHERVMYGAASGEVYRRTTRIAAAASARDRSRYAATDEPAGKQRRFGETTWPGGFTVRCRFRRGPRVSGAPEGHRRHFLHERSVGPARRAARSRPGRRAARGGGNAGSRDPQDSRHDGVQGCGQGGRSADAGGDRHAHAKAPPDRQGR